MPQNLDAFYIRFKQICTQQAGSIRTFPSGVIQSNTVLGGQPRTNVDDRSRNVSAGAPVIFSTVSQSQVSVPQIEVNIRSEQFEDRDSVSENASCAFYYWTGNIELAMKVPAETMEAHKLALTSVKTKLLLNLRSALCKPDNFDADDTGLSSGCLEFQKWGFETWDYSKGIVVVPGTFSGIFVLDHTTSSILA